MTHRGDTGVALARRFRPDAITLDLRLPELDGWKVLDLLKHDPATRHIPVHIISATDQRQRALELGAIAHLTKPVERQALAEALDRPDQLRRRASCDACWWWRTTRPSGWRSSS